MQEKNEFNQPLGKLIENWSAAKYPEKIVLEGNYCRIEPMNINKHAKELFENLTKENSGESWTYLPYGPFSNNNEFNTWLEKVIKAEEGTELYTILNNNHIAIGIAGYLRINPLHGVIEIGHLHFSKLLQKTPAATEAMYLMMHFAFETLGYRRYEWKCNSLNESSCKAALRFGFTFEGVFRQSNIFKNRNRDTAWFSILDSEWAAIKNKFQRWLDPNNFDANGKQVKKLAEIC